VYSAIPATAITISDLLETVLIDYILYKAYSLDSTAAMNRTRSDSYFSRVLQALGLSEQIDDEKDPSAHALREVSQP